MTLATSTDARDTRRIELRRLARNDQTAVFTLLDGLPRLYPGGTAWLRRRLGQVLDGCGMCTLATVDGSLAGVSIETPKAANNIKLSTLFVRDAYRHFGVGTALLSRCVETWQQHCIASAHVTVATTVEPQLRPLLTSFGFSHSAVVRDRYGRGRHEAIYVWEPQMKTALFSIRPPYATAAFDRKKRFEYRRCRVGLQTGDVIIVYESAPTSLITGTFKAGRVVQGDDDLADLESLTHLREEVSHYLRGVQRATAIEICDPRRLSVPKPVTALEGMLRPPQSYCFLRRSPEWVSLP